MAENVKKVCTVTADELANVPHGHIAAHIWGLLGAAGFPVEAVGPERWRISSGAMWCDNTAEGRTYTWVGSPC